MIGRAIAIVCALGAVAAADSAHLGEARAAIDGVRYDDAQRLLVAALEEGGNSAAALKEIYKLSASTAVVLGQAEAGEQYYRRWLALDPAATVGDDVAPKLRAPFDAARAFIAAHGRFEARVTRLSPSEIEITVISDPLGMSRGVRLDGQPPVSFGGDRRIRLAVVPGPTRAMVIDDHDNELVELEVGDIAAPDRPAPIPRRPKPRSKGALLGWGIPCITFLAAGTGFSIAALSYDQKLDRLASSDSKDHYFTEVQDAKKLRNVFIWLGGGGLVVGGLLAIPASIYLARYRSSEDTMIAPYAGDGGGGVTMSGRF